MESSEKILKNCDILQSIFHYLDFKEHLKLIKICPQFEFAIVHGVWRLICKKLHFSRCSGEGNIFLQYNAAANVKFESSLTTEAIHIILHHSSMYINKLELNHILVPENIFSLKYCNLTELTLQNIFIEDTHLKQLAENCLNLKSFTFLNFRNSNIRSNIAANVFGEMKALNKLEINDMYCIAWSYFDVKQLFCLAHLKTLIININIHDSNDNNHAINNNSTKRVNNIETLRIGQLPYLQSSNICFIKDLIYFGNLTKLSIKWHQLPSLGLDDNDLAQMNNACPKLCELSFFGCYFSFKEFPRMNNLMDLTFQQCSNIRFENYNEIFRKLKLKSLSLLAIIVRDRPENILDYNFISNTLEILTIKNIFDRYSVTIFCNRQHKFENVTKVRILKNQVDHSQPPGLYFSHNFPHLQELIMDSFYISSEDILYLEHLKVLVFSLYDNMSWSYLKILFQHPTLTHITIIPFLCSGLKRYSKHLPICYEGLTTTLEYLSLPSVVYESNVSFWPSFQERNKLLKLHIVDYHKYTRSMS